MFQKDKLAEFLEEPLAKARLKEVPASDPDSLSDLIAWLGAQPSERAYDWYDICGCMMFKYFTEACRLEVGDFGSVEYAYDAPFTGEGYHKVGRPLPWTMGAALLRARAYQATIGSGS